MKVGMITWHSGSIQEANIAEWGGAPTKAEALEGEVRAML